MVSRFTVEILIPLTGLQILHLSQYIPTSIWREGVYQHSKVTFQDSRGFKYARIIYYQKKWYWGGGEEFPKHYQLHPDPGLKQIKVLCQKQAQGTLSPQEKAVLDYWCDVKALAVWSRLFSYVELTM